jgi:hypothetical protein
MLGLLVIGLSCRVGSSGGSQRDAPQATPISEEAVNEFKSAVNAAELKHPRIFFDAGQIPALQAQASSTHAEIWTAIKTHVDRQFGVQPSINFLSRNDGTIYRDYGDQQIGLAFACVMTQADNYCNLAKQYLFTFVEWDQWGENNERSLGHAHMLMGNAIAYDWLYDRLTPEERQAVRTSLAAWTQKLYEASAEPSMVGEWNNWWRKAYVQNHYHIIHGALGIAGLVLMGEDDRAPLWVTYAAERMVPALYILQHIGDGSWHEGMGYQGYMLTMALPFLVNLRNLAGADSDLIPHDYLQRYPTWRVYNHLPGTDQFILPYGDVDFRFLGSETQNILRFIASEYNDGLAEWMAQQIISAGGRRQSGRATAWYVFEFFYYDPSVPVQPPGNLPGARVFDDLEGVIWRTGWTENDLVFGLKTGPYGGRFVFDTFTQEAPPWDVPCTRTRCKLNHGHNHDDSNTFSLWWGDWLAPEVAQPGESATEFHNTLLIDGRGQDRPDGDDNIDPQVFVGGDAFLEATADTANFDYVAADATRRYRSVQGLQDLTRYVVFIRPDYLVMLDRVAADSPHQVDWISHFNGRVAVSGNWVQANTAGGRTLGVGVAAPQRFEATTGDNGLPFVRIAPADDVANVRFINVLYPTLTATWATRPAITVLADSEQAAVIRIQWNDNSGRTDDVLFHYGDSGTVTAGPYETDAQVAAVVRGPEGQVQRLFVYGGTFLKDLEANQVLASELDSAKPFESIASGQ